MVDPLVYLFRVVEMGEDELLSDPLVRMEVGRLVGLELSRDVEKAVRQVVEKWSVLRRYFTKRCVSTGGEGSIGTDDLCIYIYKEVFPTIYYRNPVLATMRGLIVLFRNDGVVEIVSRPFDKFFNMHEVPDTEELPSGDRLITRKYDGTLVHCFRDPYTGDVRCATRGLLDVHGVRPGKVKMYIDSPGLDDRVIRNPYVKKFWEYIDDNNLSPELEELVDDNHTVMFELVCGKPASIQPGLPEPGEKCTPILLARRNKETLDIEYFTGEHVFPTPETYDDIPPLNSGDKEGVVVYYPGQVYKGIWWWKYLVKIKDPRYLLDVEIHPRGELHWGRVMRQIVLGKSDDLIPLLPDEKETIKQLWEKWETLRQLICESMEKGTVPQWFEKRYGREARKRGCEPIAKKIVIETTGTRKTREQVERLLERLINQFGK